MESYEEKKKKLLEKIEEYTGEDLIVAFSGGADSSLLLKLAADRAEKKKHLVHAVTICSELQPDRDLKTAKQVAGEVNALHHVLKVREIEEAGIKNNPKDRCYLCKKYLFGKMKELAGKLDIHTILEGTNEDDLHVYRPGIRAIKELGILSPLSDARLTKEEVRALAKEQGLSVAGRPAAPCLATRFPYGAVLEPARLKQAEKGEAFLKEAGFEQVRLRIYENLVRIEVEGEKMQRFLENRSGITAYLKQLGFTYITLDMEGFRSGSMDL